MRDQPIGLGDGIAPLRAPGRASPFASWVRSSACDVGRETRLPAEPSSEAAPWFGRPTGRDGPGFSAAHRTRPGVRRSRGQPDRCGRIEAGARKRCSIRSMPPSMEKSPPQPLEGGIRQRSAPFRFARQKIDGVRQRFPIARRHQHAVDAVADEFGDAGEIGRHDREFLARRLPSAHWANRPGRRMRPSWTAARRGPPRAAARRCRAAPSRRETPRGRRCPLCRSLRLQAVQKIAAAHMGEAPMQIRRQGGERPQQIAEAFLRDRAPDRDDADGIGRIGAVPHRARFGRRGKARQVEAVIDERDTVGHGREGLQMLGSLRRAGDAPQRVGELLALLPIRRRPDVLGMGRERPGAAGQQRGIAHDGSGRVQIMDVDVPDIRRAARAP